jgi:hypothetical protein
LLVLFPQSFLGLFSLNLLQISTRSHILSITMKISAIVLGALAAQGVSAHYFFDATISNGVASPSFQYVRGFTRAVSYNPIKFSSNPAADIRDGSHADGPDIRCNQGAFSKAGNTQVLTVNAGSEVRLRLGVNAKMEHPGS